MKLESFADKVRAKQRGHTKLQDFRCDSCGEWKSADDRVKNPKSRMCKQCENSAQTVRAKTHPVTRLKK